MTQKLNKLKIKFFITINLLLLMISINFQLQKLDERFKEAKLATTNDLNTV